MECSYLLAILRSYKRVEIQKLTKHKERNDLLSVASFFRYKYPKELPNIFYTVIYFNSLFTCLFVCLFALNDSNGQNKTPLKWRV